VKFQNGEALNEAIKKQTIRVKLRKFLQLAGARTPPLLACATFSREVGRIIQQSLKIGIVPIIICKFDKQYHRYAATCN